MNNIKLLHLKKASMPVALPVISSLHSGQMQGFKLVLMIKDLQFLFNQSNKTFHVPTYLAFNIYSLASFTEEMPIPTLEDSSRWNHLFQAHLFVINIENNVVLDGCITD